MTTSSIERRQIEVDPELEEVEESLRPGTGLREDASDTGPSSSAPSRGLTLVYLERSGGAIGANTVSHLSSRQSSSDAGSTCEGSLAAPSSKSGTCRAMAVLQVASALAMPPSKLDRAELARFTEKLQAAGLDLSRWGVRGTKSVEHLFWEVYQQRGCLILGLRGGTNKPLKRVTRLVKIRLTAEIFGVCHTLYSRMQFMHDGQTIERRQVPLRRLLWKDNAEGMMPQVSGDELYDEGCPYTEDWREGCRKALKERLGLSETWQQQHLIEDEDSYAYHIEDDVQSAGYPGLNTLYCIHEITLRVSDPEHSQVQCIGLPQGQEFATTEGEFNFSGQLDEDGLPIGTQLNIWTWDRSEQRKSVPNCMSPTSSARSSREISTPSSTKQMEQLLIKRVPLPSTAAAAVAAMQMRLDSLQSAGDSPSQAMACAMKGMRTDWDRVKKIASNILKPGYSLKDFNTDLCAFPELNLYLLQEGTNSGNSIGDEYQRTVGAFFAIYWLMRFQVDGREGFAFGVDDAWQPASAPINSAGVRAAPTASASRSAKEKRLEFYNSEIWGRFQKLFIDAGLLSEERRWFGRTVYTVNQRRLVSLLALTAVHDIMKMSLLLPQVQAKDAPYRGYSAGDVISDHDAALGYLMDHYPNLLPSFNELDREEKRSIQFTQCDLCFNFGWLVQAEAPPGATFSLFKAALIRDHKSQLSRQDVALYFVHWLTDLAGAEPTPLGGGEKFVLKFPLEVLNSFLRSFEYAQRITDKTETEVMEEYLKVRWTEHDPPLGPCPTGDTAIAKLRLACQAQSNAQAMLHAFERLSDEEKEVLSVEMARTGTLCQSYSLCLAPEEVSRSPAGPAFIVYYGPAFLQRALEHADDAIERLSVLAEIYQRARELWPANVAKAAQNVTIRIDMIKSLNLAETIQANRGSGDVWIMMKHNEHEGFVELCSRRKLNKLIATRATMQILDFLSTQESV